MSVTLEPIHKRTLVAKATEIADVACRKEGQVSQLRNLLTVAQAESEIPVLRNFIEYQAGRGTTQDFWSPIHKDVIGVLEQIGSLFPGDEDLRRSKALQSFFGYMVRRYVYMTEMAKMARKKAWNERRRQESSAYGKGGSR